LWTINLNEHGPEPRFDAATRSIKGKKRMLTRMRTLAVGAVLLALIGLGVAGGRVFAAQSGAPATSAAYQVFVAKLANNLGVTDPTKVDAAIRSTLKQMVDDQLATGTISAKKATQLKKTIDAADQPGDLLGLDQFAVKTDPTATPGNGGNATDDGNGVAPGNGVDNHGGNAGPDDQANSMDDQGGNAGVDDNGNGVDNHGGNSGADDNGAGNATGEDNHGGNVGADDNENGNGEIANGNAGDGNASGDDHGGDSGGHGGNGGGDDHGGDSGSSGHGGDD
jgi:hypothetical protein